MEGLPERVRLIAAPGELRDVVLGVLGWSTDDFTGETVLLCRLVDGSSGEIPARPPAALAPAKPPQHE